MPFAQISSWCIVRQCFQLLSLALTPVFATSAFSQSDPEQVLHLLRLSLQCPVPLQMTEDAGGKKRTLMTETFTGNAKTLVISGKTVIHTSDPQSFVSTDEETFTFTANFSVLSGVSVNNNLVKVACSSGACIRKLSQHNLFPIPNCTRPGCDDAFRKQQFQSKDMTLILCDKEIAENTKFAIEYFIKPKSAAGPFSGVPLILQPTK